MTIEMELSDVVENCTRGIATAILQNTNDPKFEVYTHDALQDIGDYGCLITLYEYDVFPKISNTNKWDLTYGIQVFDTDQMSLVNNTNLIIQAIERPFLTKSIGYIKARSIHAVTDYYKSTSRLTNIRFTIELWLRKPQDNVVPMNDSKLTVTTKE